MKIKIGLTILSLILVFFSFSGCLSVKTHHPEASPANKLSFDWSGLTPEYNEDHWTWFEPFMEKMIHKKVLDHKDLSRPFEAITQGEFLHWLFRVLDFSTSHQDSPFSLQMDICSNYSDHPYYHDICRAYEKEILHPEELLHPDQPLIRSDAARWLIKAKGGSSLEKQALSVQNPIIFAQDGHHGLSFEIQACLALAYAPEHQLMHYRWRNDNEFRWVEPFRSLNKAETAYSLYQLLHPPQRGGTLIAGAIHSKPNQPLLQQSELLPLIYSKVISKKDIHWGYYPLLVEQIPTIENGGWKIFDDGRMEITFHFRKGLKWSDGKPMTALDAVYAFEHLHELPEAENFAEYIDWIEKVEALDTFTYRTWWKQPFLYANKFIHVLPSHLSHSSPIHAGPYILEAENDSEQLLFRANLHFVLGPPLIDTVQVVEFETEQELFNALKDGKIDISWGQWNTQEIQKRIQKNNLPYNFLVSPSLSWEHISLNIDHPFFSDQRVRKALLFSLDRDAIVKQCWDNTSYPAYSWFPLPHPAIKKNQLPLYPFDMEKAELWLDNAGWKLNPDQKVREKDGNQFAVNLITTSGNMYREKTVNYIAKQWEKIGIKVETHLLDHPAFFDEILKKRKFEGATASLFAWHFTPESMLYSLVHSSMIPSLVNDYRGQNYTSISHPIVDDLSLGIFRELNPIYRYQQLSKLHSMLMEEIPALPLLHYASMSIVRQNIKGYHPSSLHHPPWYNIVNWHMEQ